MTTWTWGGNALAVSAASRSSTDPRPVIVTGVTGPRLLGGRCAACNRPNPTTAPRCPRCGGECAHAVFGPEGAIWAVTTIHVTGGRAAPYTLAYVDLDDGPRLLAHVNGRAEVEPRVRARVRLVELTDHGDPQVEVIR